MKAAKEIQKTARVLFRSCMVNGRLDEGCVRQVLKGLASHSSRGVLSVLMELKKLVGLEVLKERVVVESAVSLPDGGRGIFGQVLKTRPDVSSLEYREDPKLIGGLKIRIGFDVWDGTVLERLHAFESKME
jgi:F-type H+-transporting ATPase subunit delta